ncbi:hypothetical protein IVA88_31165 [Bradyrhizobium sp. 149]|uniref:hypothetical protein n=1 Tax=Bradyrhizobium sp. 149 TaxID=2782624 RepID=UPI001FFA142B|nr:hypothetical protein [Bradyrhizobium sp. 149]MCK1655845.1 hypothetical protein [Bradyrhizobium sp. 149]
MSDGDMRGSPQLQMPLSLIRANSSYCRMNPLAMRDEFQESIDLEAVAVVVGDPEQPTTPPGIAILRILVTSARW